MSRNLRNGILNVVGEGLWGFQAALVSASTVLVVVLCEYGAGPAMIGSIASVEIVALLLPQILGVYIFRSRAGRQRQLVGFHYFAIVPFLFVIGILLLPPLRLSPVAIRWGTFVGYASFLAAIGTMMAVWLDWLASLFDIRVRGTAMGLGFGVSAAAGTGGGLLAGWLIRASPGPATYAGLYFAAGVLAVLSASVFLFMDDQAATTGEVDPPSAAVLVGHFRNSMEDRNFRSFLVGRILATAGFCLLPLVALHYASPEGGGVTPGTLVGCGATMGVGTAISNLALGRLGDRHGHRAGLLIGVGMQMAALVVLLFVRGVAGCVAAYFIAGLCAGSASISHYNMLFETCPHESRSAHITVANLLVGICTAAMPTAAGFAAGRWGTRPVFAASLAISTAALAWFVFCVQEPRSRPGAVTWADSCSGGV